MESGMNLRSLLDGRAGMPQDSNGGGVWDCGKLGINWGSRAIVASLSAEPLHAFARDDRHHDKCGERIGPPPAQQRVQQQSGKKYGGKIGTEVGLARVGLQGAAA